MSQREGKAASPYRKLLGWIATLLNIRRSLTMKKLIAVLAVALLAAPAMAADWSFYGSARMSTFYDHETSETTPVNGEDDDWRPDLEFSDQLPSGRQGQSRQGVRQDRARPQGHRRRRRRRRHPAWPTASGNFRTTPRSKSAKTMARSTRAGPTGVWTPTTTCNGIGTGYGLSDPGMILLQIGGLQLGDSSSAADSATSVRRRCGRIASKIRGPATP